MSDTDIILLKQLSSAGEVPIPGGLTAGEVAVNSFDRRIYSKDSNGIVFDLLQNNQNGGQSLYFSGITTDGTTTEVPLDVTSSTDKKSVVYNITITSPTDYQTLSLSILFDEISGVIKFTQYAVIKTSANSLISFNPVLSSGFLVLNVTPAAGSQLKIEFSRLDVSQSTSQDKSVFFNSLATTGTTPQIIDTFDKTLIKASTYNIQLTDSVSGVSNFLSYKVIHDGLSTVNSLSYNFLSTSGAISVGSFGVTINNNNVELSVTPTGATGLVSLSRIDLPIS